DRASVREPARRPLGRHPCRHPRSRGWVRGHRRLHHVARAVPEPRDRQPPYRRRSSRTAGHPAADHGAPLAGGGDRRRRGGRTHRAPELLGGAPGDPRRRGPASRPVPGHGRGPDSRPGRVDTGDADGRGSSRRVRDGRAERGDPTGRLCVPDDHGDRHAHAAGYGQRAGPVRSAAERRTGGCRASGQGVRQSRARLRRGCRARRIDGRGGPVLGDRPTARRRRHVRLGAGSGRLPSL
ncbi:MAG: hypothetical protein AVDCRST_MAG10-3513, partial [uncultured Acidimicrobiales bacterium]